MDNKNLFIQKSDIYSISRPEYSLEFIKYLFETVGFNKKSIIADVGSGTGIFAKQLAEFCDTVFCVEPNSDMRRVAYQNLSSYHNIHIIDGSAENTKLENNSVDFITAAQAFHWFEPEKFLTESKRILKPNGKVVLVWNMRDTECDLSKENYRIFSDYCPKFKGYSNGLKKDDLRIIRYFSEKYETIEFDYPILYDKKKFIHRCLSSSYSLKEGDDRYDAYIKELEVLFEKYSINGLLTMPNKTIAYIGII